MVYPDINYIAVLVATAVAFGIGAIWYSVLFGRPWMVLLGKTKEELGDSKRAMLTSVALTLIHAFAIAVIVGWSRVTSAWGGLGVGLFVGIALIAPVTALNDVYEDRPLKLFLITAGHLVVISAVMALIITLF